MRVQEQLFEKHRVETYRRATEGSTSDVVNRWPDVWSEAPCAITSAKYLWHDISQTSLQLILVDIIIFNTQMSVRPVPIVTSNLKSRTMFKHWEEVNHVRSNWQTGFEVTRSKVKVSTGGNLKIDVTLLNNKSITLVSLHSSTPPYTPRSSRFGSEPPFVEDDVDVWLWHYAILRVACQKQQHWLYSDVALCNIYFLIFAVLVVWRRSQTLF